MDYLNALVGGINLAAAWTKSKDPPALDPMQTIVTLALLVFRPEKTKLGFRQYSIQLQDGSSHFQGVTRWWNGDSNDDTRHLEKAVKKCIGYYRNEDIKVIFRLAIEGLKKLKQTYEDDLAGTYVGTLITELEKARDKPEETSQEYPEPVDQRDLAWKVKQLWNKETLEKYAEWLTCLDRNREKKTDDQELEFNTTLPIIEANLLYKNAEFIRVYKVHNRPET